MVKVENIGALIVQKHREVLLTNKADGEVKVRLTQIESPKMDLSAEADEIKDADGATIDKMYKSKTAKFSFENSLWDLRLADAQTGAERTVATTVNKLIVPVSETIKIAEAKVSLKQTPVGVVKYVYKLVNRDLAEKLTLGTGETATEGEFIIKGKEIILPTGTEGVLFIEYNYESSNAVRSDNKASKFPEAMGFIDHVIFKDPCTKELIAGSIIAPFATFDPTSVSWDFSKGAKHGATIELTKDYCDEVNDTLFSFILAQD